MKDKFRIPEDIVGLSGFIRVWITDNKTGIKRLVFEDRNAVQAAYANAVVDGLDGGTNYAIDNRFSGNTNLGVGNNGEDGIAIKDIGGLWYEMSMIANVRSTGWLTMSGTFTGTGITVDTSNDVLLGHSWNNAGSTFDTLIAKPTAWTSQAVLITETLTIDWIIKHQTT